MGAKWSYNIINQHNNYNGTQCKGPRSFTCFSTTKLCGGT